MIGKAHARLVDDVRAHGPHIGDRGVVAAHVLCLALERVEYGSEPVRELSLSVSVRVSRLLEARSLSQRPNNLMNGDELAGPRIWKLLGA